MKARKNILTIMGIAIIISFIIWIILSPFRAFSISPLISPVAYYLGFCLLTWIILNNPNHTNRIPAVLTGLVLGIVLPEIGFSIPHYTSCMASWADGFAGIVGILFIGLTYKKFKTNKVLYTLLLIFILAIVLAYASVWTDYCMGLA